jgi:hypothetical protein
VGPIITHTYLVKSAATLQCQQSCTCAPLDCTPRITLRWQRAWTMVSRGSGPKWNLHPPPAADTLCRLDTTPSCLKAKALSACSYTETDELITNLPTDLPHSQQGMQPLQVPQHCRPLPMGSRCAPPLPLHCTLHSAVFLPASAALAAASPATWAPSKHGYLICLTHGSPQTSSVITISP